MKVLSTLLLLTSLGGVASAATIVQTQNFAFVPNGSQVLTFNKFDTIGGTRTLLSVTITVTLNKTGGSFEVDNDSASGGTISLTHTVQGALTSSLGSSSLLDTSFAGIGSSGTLNAVSSLNNQAVSATTGDATNTFNSTGLGDNIVFNPADQTASSSGTVNSLFTSMYAGSGTFTNTLAADQLVSATGLGGLQQSFTVSNVSGDVTITYNYVPEPASTMLGGLGVIVLLTRHRRR